MLYNGWAVFAALIYSFAVFPTLAEKLENKNLTSGLRAASAFCMLSSTYLVGVGGFLAIDWSNPFAGKEDEVARSVHSLKAWIVVAAISVWPYLLIAVGLFTGYLGTLGWRRARKNFKLRHYQ